LARIIFATAFGTRDRGSGGLNARSSLACTCP
jgi:hypothetical protein